MHNSIHINTENNRQCLKYTYNTSLFQQLRRPYNENDATSMASVSNMMKRHFEPSLPPGTVVPVNNSIWPLFYLYLIHNYKRMFVCLSCIVFNCEIVEYMVGWGYRSQKSIISVQYQYSNIDIVKSISTFSIITLTNQVQLKRTPRVTEGKFAKLEKFANRSRLEK